MSILWTIVIGLIAGALAKLIMPGKDPGGILVTIGLGIAGALVAKFLGQLAGLYQEGQSAGLIGSVVGAVILLWIYRVVKSRKAAAH
jgi:uncharacterized membrane protein YeaQ/YmgE (transglycosylase-associated protein family)